LLFISMCIDRSGDSKAVPIGGIYDALVVTVKWSPGYTSLLQ